MKSGFCDVCGHKIGYSHVIGFFHKQTKDITCFCGCSNPIEKENKVLAKKIFFEKQNIEILEFIRERCSQKGKEKNITSFTIRDILKNITKFWDGDYIYKTVDILTEPNDIKRELMRAGAVAKISEIMYKFSRDNNKMMQLKYNQYLKSLGGQKLLFSHWYNDTTFRQDNIFTKLNPLGITFEQWLRVNPIIYQTDLGDKGKIYRGYKILLDFSETELDKKVKRHLNTAYNIDGLKNVLGD